MATHVVIMAGGVGSRLYPLSTPEHPKQFLDLLECGKTLIQLTYERFLAVDSAAQFWVVTSADYVHFVHEQLPSIPDEHILAEPVARNTAPCIAYACWKIKARYPDANVVVTPADAYVPDCAAFAATIRPALEFASQGSRIVCVGINPLSPHTGYGYVKVSSGNADAVVRKVDSFKEKPDMATAERYLAEGGYYWNAGIFVWNVATIESELRTHAPQITGVMDELAPVFYTEGENAALGRLFPTCDKISIDYAVMEKSKEVYVAASDWEWSDLGSFEALEAVKKSK